MLKSDPTKVDSDHDGLDDYEEQRIWSTDPQNPDTDDDGFLDSADPRPLVEDNPPRVSEIRSDNYNEYVELAVQDENTVSVEAKPKYDPVKPLEDPFWNTSLATVTDTSGGEYRIDFDGHGILGEPPEEYWVNLTDAHVNERTVKINVKDGGGAELAATGVVAGGAVASPNEPTLIASALAGGVIIGLSAGGLYLVNEYVTADGETVKNQPATGVEAHYPASETVLATTVTLPTGTVATEVDPRTGETVARGHGWQYIAETTGLAQAELEQVLRDDSSIVYEHGYGDYTVIGRTNYLEEVVISIIGGTIMVASTEEPAEGPCEKEIHFEQDAEHGVRDGKPLDKLDEVRDAIESAKQVWKSGNSNTPTWLYYLTKIEGKGWTIIKVGPKGLHPLAEWVFSTILASDKPDGFFNSKDEALNNLKDRPDNPERVDNDPARC